MPGVRSMLRTLDPSTVRRYSDYVRSIKPKTEQQTLNRWIFAFCSIHTTWENNVKGYLALKNSRLGNMDHIRTALRTAGVGLHNCRARYLHAFGERFWRSPNSYSNPGRAERDRLSRELLGIGLAKTTFAFELIDPTARMICLDRHVLNWMEGVERGSKLNGNMTVLKYRKLEDRWIRACREFKFDPIAARHACWDINKGRTDMRYWSYVLEDS